MQYGMQLIAALRSASARITPQPIGSSGRHGSSLARAEIGFITDVEGDWSYFERCISLSRVLYRDDSKALQNVQDHLGHVASIARLAAQPHGQSGVGRRGSEVLLEKMMPHFDKLADAASTPVSQWGVTKLASDRLSNLLPKPVWAMLGLGYLYSFVAGIAANPTIFALTMLAFV